jgi:hypothetical protein
MTVAKKTTGSRRNTPSIECVKPWSGEFNLRNITSAGSRSTRIAPKIKAIGSKKTKTP